jgi:hypothetical protein
MKKAIVASLARCSLDFARIFITPVFITPVRSKRGHANDKFTDCRDMQGAGMRSRASLAAGGIAAFAVAWWHRSAASQRHRWWHRSTRPVPVAAVQVD